MDTGSETPLLMLHPTCIFYHDCIHPAQVENKEPDMERVFFSSSSSSVLQTAGLLFFFLFPGHHRGPHGTQGEHECVSM